MQGWGVLRGEKLTWQLSIPVLGVAARLTRLFIQRLQCMGSGYKRSDILGGFEQRYQLFTDAKLNQLCDADCDLPYTSLVDADQLIIITHNLVRG